MRLRLPDCLPFRLLVCVKVAHTHTHTQRGEKCFSSPPLLCERRRLFCMLPRCSQSRSIGYYVQRPAAMEHMCPRKKTKKLNMMKQRINTATRPSQTKVRFAISPSISTILRKCWWFLLEATPPPPPAPVARPCPARLERQRRAQRLEESRRGFRCFGSIGALGSGRNLL